MSVFRCQPLVALAAGLIENEDNETVENVQVSLSGEMSYNVLTTKDGNYAFNELTEGGDYTITPLKDDDYNNGLLCAPHRG